MEWNSECNVGTQVWNVVFVCNFAIPECNFGMWVWNAMLECSVGMQCVRAQPCNFGVQFCNALLETTFLEHSFGCKFGMFGMQNWNAISECDVGNNFRMQC